MTLIHGPKEISLSQNTRDQYVVEIAGSLAGHYAGRLFCDAGARVVQLRPEGGIDEAAKLKLKERESQVKDFVLEVDLSPR